MPGRARARNRLNVRRCLVVADLIRALLAGAAGAVLPGYFWAAVLRPTSGLGERLAWSTGLSMASVLIVFGSGLLVYRLKGPATGTAAWP